MTVHRVVVALVAWWAAGALLLANPAIVLAADELSGSQQELNEVQQQIDATLRALRGRQSEAGDLSSDLTKLDESMQRLRGLIQRSTRELARLDLQLDEVQRNHDDLRRRQAVIEQQLEKRLVALYKAGQTGMASALLSTAGTPLELAEKYAFLSRIVRHDRELMAEYRRQGVAIEQTLADLRRLRDNQEVLSQRRRTEQTALDAAGAAKKQLLAEARAEETRLTGALSDLRARAARLAELVKKLESAKTPSYTDKNEIFTVQQGSLPWPISGRVRRDFGANRHPELGTQIESNGLEIEAAPRTAVQAIWSGRVLYASPLKGFGNLMVIDHGDKYFSLYGHVADFSRKVGDIVKPREVIGFSGHEGRDFIYFELRHQGAPVDPSGWLAPR